MFILISMLTNATTIVVCENTDVKYRGSNVGTPRDFNYILI
jgi:hypothetical protein